MSLYVRLPLDRLRGDHSYWRARLKESNIPSIQTLKQIAPLVSPKAPVRLVLKSLEQLENPGQILGVKIQQKKACVFFFFLNCERLKLIFYADGQHHACCGRKRVKDA